jgi:hypothetical protein
MIEVWFIALTYVSMLGQHGHAELEGRFDSKSQCESFMFMVTSIYQARFKKVTLECKRMGEREA